jgi:hypothetical protein
MSDHRQPIIDRMNEVWGLHERRYKAPGPEGRCLAFFIDPRSVEFEGIEMRLGVSFGDNPVTPETKQGWFLPIPALPGKYVFGLHLVGTRDHKLAMFDQWQDAREAPADCTDASEVERAARSILESISDDKYFDSVGEEPKDKGPVKVSSLLPLDKYELVRDEEL